MMDQRYTCLMILLTYSEGTKDVVGAITFNITAFA